MYRASEVQKGTEIIHRAAESYRQYEENEALGEDRHLECSYAKEWKVYLDCSMVVRLSDALARNIYIFSQTSAQFHSQNL
jgi:hypothetical protein